MKKSKDFSYWYERIIKLIGIRPRSRQEVVAYLSKKGVESTISEQVVRKCEEMGLINDLEFVHWFIEQRQTFRPKGKYALRFELRQKGVNLEIIDQAIAQLGSQDEVTAAWQVVERKLRIWQNVAVSEKRRKIQSVLTTRGFNWDIIQKVIERVESK